MNKILFGIALFAGILMIATGFKEEADTKQLIQGNEIPAFQITNGHKTLTISQNDSKYLLLTFWESKDAQSRMACNKYDKQINNDNSLNKIIDFAAINFDESVSLYEEIVSSDRLTVVNQYHPDGQNRETMKKIYGLNEGYGSVLISPSGEILSFNPDISYLAKLVF